MSARFVAAEIAAVEGPAAAAKNLEVLVDCPFHQARQSHERLEDRAGSQLRLNRSIEHRFVEITDHLAPVVSADSADKPVHVELRLGGHSENLAIPRVQGDHRSAPTAHGQVRDDLQIEVDRKTQSLACFGLLAVQIANPS